MKGNWVAQYCWAVPGKSSKIFSVRASDICGKKQPLSAKCSGYARFLLHFHVASSRMACVNAQTACVGQVKEELHNLHLIIHHLNFNIENWSMHLCTYVCVNTCARECACVLMHRCGWVCVRVCVCARVFVRMSRAFAIVGRLLTFM